MTFIEEETMESLRRDHKLELAPGEARRNVVTRGTPLNHLVGREFRVGEAVLRHVELCEHLVNATGKKSLLPNLIHRGGLYAQVLASAEIRTGNEIEEVR